MLKITREGTALNQDKYKNLIVAADKEYQKKEVFKICKKSWEKFLPDYKLILIDEDSEYYKKYIDKVSDNIKNLKHKGYLFISIGFLVLQELGGIMLEADAELLDYTLYNHKYNLYGNLSVGIKSFCSGAPIKVKKDDKVFDFIINEWFTRFKYTELNVYFDEDFLNKNCPYSWVTFNHHCGISLLKKTGDYYESWFYKFKKIKIIEKSSYDGIKDNNILPIIYEKTFVRKPMDKNIEFENEGEDLLSTCRSISCDMITAKNAYIIFSEKVDKEDIIMDDYFKSILN